MVTLTTLCWGACLPCQFHVVCFIFSWRWVANPNAVSGSIWALASNRTHRAWLIHISFCLDFIKQTDWSRILNVSPVWKYSKLPWGGGGDEIPF